MTRFVRVGIALLVCGVFSYAADRLFSLPPETMHGPVEPDRSPLAAKRAAAWKDLRALCRAKKMNIYIYCENPTVSHIAIMADNDRIPWPQVYDVANKKLIDVPLPHAIAIGSNQITW